MPSYSALPGVVRSVEVTNLLAGYRMLIEWALNEVTDGVTIYEIWRSSNQFQAFEKVAEVPSPMHQYIDTVPFTSGIVFYYKVIAKSATGLRSDFDKSEARSDSTFDSFEESPFRATVVTFDNFRIGEVPTLTVTIPPAVANTYTLMEYYRFNTVEVFVNGVALVRGVGFVENSDQLTITLTNPVPTSGTIIVNYLAV